MSARSGFSHKWNIKGCIKFSYDFPKNGLLELRNSHEFEMIFSILKYMPTPILTKFSWLVDAGTGSKFSLSGLQESHSLGWDTFLHVKALHPLTIIPHN